MFTNRCQRNTKRNIRQLRICVAKLSEPKRDKYRGENLGLPLYVVEIAAVLKQYRKKSTSGRKCGVMNSHDVLIGIALAIDGVALGFVAIGQWHLREAKKCHVQALCDLRQAQSLLMLMQRDYERITKADAQNGGAGRTGNRPV